MTALPMTRDFLTSFRMLQEDVYDWFTRLSNWVLCKPLKSEVQSQPQLQQQQHFQTQPSAGVDQQAQAQHHQQALQMLQQQHQLDQQQQQLEQQGKLLVASQQEVKSLVEANEALLLASKNAMQAKLAAQQQLDMLREQASKQTVSPHHLQ